MEAAREPEMTFEQGPGVDEVLEGEHGAKLSALSYQLSARSSLSRSG
jgi:hypothetical protein